MVGKVHNFVTTVLNSRKRHEAFRAVQRDLVEDDPLWNLGTLNLVRDGGIRWHSAHLKLRHCLELKDAIGRFQRQMRSAAGLDEW